MTLLLSQVHTRKYIHIYIYVYIYICIAPLPQHRALYRSTDKKNRRKEKGEETQRRQQHSVAPDKGTPPLPLPLSPSAAAISPPRAAAALRERGRGRGGVEKGGGGIRQRGVAEKGAGAKSAMATSFHRRKKKGIIMYTHANTHKQKWAGAKSAMATSGSGATARGRRASSFSCKVN